jgi:DNA ligase 1
LIEYTKLYKQRQDGKYQGWYMVQNDDHYHSVSYICDVNGVPVETSIVTSDPRLAKPTNEGRSNFRDGVAQAKFVIEAAIKSRLEQGYVRNIGDQPMILDKISPMLADTFSNKTKLPNTYYSQPKLDGIRAIITKEGLFSRSWKPILSAPHIHTKLMPLLEEGYIFDGELYNHQFKDNFNKIISLTRKTKPTDLDLAESEELVQFWCFDMILSDQIFSDRYELMKELLTDFDRSIVITPTTEVNSKEQLDSVYGEYLENGFEGQMIRIDAEYEHRRSKYLIKRKEFIDQEFKIIDIQPGDGNWAGAAKRIICLTDDGNQFTGTLKGNFEFAEQVLINRDKYIGGEATVRFQNWSPDGKNNKGNVPRFPVTVAIYEGKREL